MKKSVKVISGILSAAIAVVASAAMAVTANASQYMYSENHKTVDCIHRWYDSARDEAVFVVKTHRGEHSMAYFTVTSTSEDKTTVASLSLTEMYRGGGATENVFANYEGSDEEYDYYNVYADLTEYNNASIKVYFSQYCERSMATDTSNGSMTEGSGFIVSK